MKNLTLFWSILFCIQLQAQFISVGANSSFGDKKNAFFLWGRHEFGLNASKSIRLGYGIRFSQFNAYKGLFLTAPLRLTKVDYTPQNANIDTLRISESHHFFTNVYIILGYTYKEKLDIRFSIDLAGLSFGNTVSGEHILNAKANSSMPKYQSVQAKPTPFNLLLVSDNDIGSLNSEFTVGYWIKEKYYVFGGYSFLFAEYTTTEKLRNDNDRFRLKGHLGTIGIAYRLK